MAMKTLIALAFMVAAMYITILHVLILVAALTILIRVIAQVTAEAGILALAHAADMPMVIPSVQDI
jgi:hypothetical protein